MAEKDAQQTAEELAVVLSELVQRTERLKQLYEQYFMGIERIEPLVARKEVTRAMIAMQQTYIRNTGLRFKFNSMLQRWNIYLTYWTRTLREIENGTYVRHIQKAARAAKLKGDALPQEMRVRGASAAIAAEGPPVAAKPAAPAAPASRPTRPPPVPSAAKGPPPIPGVARPGAAAQAPAHATGSVSGQTPPQGAPRATTAPLGQPPRQTPAQGAVSMHTPAPSPTLNQTPAQGVARVLPNIPGMSDGDLRALHKKYVDARLAVGESAPVRYETLVASLAKQVPKVLEQPGVRGVKFDVSVQAGKAVLRAIPTK